MRDAKAGAPIRICIDLSIHQTITDLTFDAARWYCRLLAAAVGTPPAFKRFEKIEASVHGVELEGTRSQFSIL